MYESGLLYRVTNSSLLHHLDCDKCCNVVLFVHQCIFLFAIDIGFLYLHYLNIICTDDNNV